MRRAYHALLVVAAFVALSHSAGASKPDPELWRAMHKIDDTEAARITLVLRNSQQSIKPGERITFKGQITNSGTKDFQLEAWGVLFPEGGKADAAKPSCRWLEGFQRVAYSSPVPRKTISPGRAYAGDFLSETVDPKTPVGVCKGKIILYGGIGANSLGVRVTADFSITIQDGATSVTDPSNTQSTGASPDYSTPVYYYLPVYHYAHDFMQPLTEVP